MGVNLLGRSVDTYYDLHADVYDIISPGQPGDVDFYLEEAQKASPPILELAVGTGRVAIHVAQAGIPVIGLDRSRTMLAEARRKAQAAGLEPDQLKLLPGDMRDFKLEQRFDLVIIAYRAFLHLQTAEDQLRALANIHDHMLPGGRLALDIWVPDPHTIAEHRAPPGGAARKYAEPIAAGNGHTIFISRMVADDPHTQVREEYVIIEQLDEGGVVIHRRYLPLRLRWIYRFEMEHLLARAGFEVESLYGYFDRRPFAAYSTEMVWVCRKP